MALMTFGITMAFLVRSSSIIGWVPLALIYIFKAKSFECIIYNLLAIIQAGLFIAIPMVFLSLCMDSLYYGTFVFPQFNFVYVNVVQNISAYFGSEPMLFYFIEFENSANVIDKGFLSIFGIALITLYQIQSKLPG
jgi:Alg9-like mannosyltransferase family